MTDEVALNVAFTGDSSGVVTESRRGADAVDDYGRKVDAFRDRTYQFGRSAKETEKALNSMGDTVKAVTGFLVAMGGVQLVSKFKEVAVESDRLRASLATVTGSTQAATTAFSELEKFATRTPFTLDQSVNAFIRMKSLGLAPTEAALESFGNTASAMGKDMMQMIEAVADASTGEFERLKEFGIRASQQGEQVTFTFQGVETTVAKTSQAITEYLQGIGEVQFAGAMSTKMESLVGLFSNLEDNVNGLFRAVGDAGASGALAEMLRSVNSALGGLKDDLPVILSDTEMLTDALVTLGSVAVARAVVPAMTVMIERMAAMSLAGGTLTGVMTGLNGVMAAFGGPVGIALVAATALLTFGTNARTAADDAETLTLEVDRLAGKLKDATEAQRELVKIQVRDKLVEYRAGLREALDDLIGYQTKINMATQEGGFFSHSVMRQQLDDYKKGIIEAQARIDSLRQAERDLTAVLNGTYEPAKQQQQSLDDIATAGTAAAAGVAKTDDSVQKAAKTFALANDPAAKFVARINEIKDLQKSGLVSQTAINNAVQDAVDAYAKAAGAGDAFNDMLEEGKRLTESLRTPMEVYTDQVARLNDLFAVGAIDQETFNRAMQSATDKLVGTNAKAAQQATNAWQEFGKTLQESFRDSFIAAEGHLGDFLKRAETALKEAAYRWAFDSTIGALFSGAFGSGGFAGTTAPVSGGGGGGSSLTGLAGTAGRTYLSGSASLAGINSGISTGATYLINGLNSAGYTGAAQYVGTAYANTTVLGNQIGNAFGMQGGGAALGGLATAGAGVVGGYVGNQLGEAAFGRTADPTVSTVGQAGGAIAGAAIGAQYGSVGGPIGAAIGAAVGAIAAVALGDKKHRDFNVGALVGPAAPANAQVAASGLRIAAYDRRGDGNVAVQFTDALMKIDAALTGLVESTGVDVNLSGRTLRGTGANSNVDTGNFFGAKGKTGKTPVSELEDAPTEFVKAWLKEVAHLLPHRVQEIMEGVDGVAEELINGLAAAIRIDDLLDLDVVKRTQDAIDALLEPQKKLIELYDDTTERVMDLAAGFTGGADSLTDLANALVDQKNAALELAMAYQGVQMETTALFGNAIDQIRQSLMSDEELYAERRAQIASLTDQLANAISPDEISRLQNQIVGLSGDAFRSLAPDQQQSLGQEFLAFLSEAQALADRQLQAGLDSLASREQGIQSTIDLELEVAQQQQRAVMDQQAAVDQFGQWVQQLTSGQAQITINIPGYGQVAVPLGYDIISEITL